MAIDATILSTILSGGMGAALGSIATAVLQINSKKGEARANAAKIITDAATEMLDRLNEENKRMRVAILLLTDVIDEIIDDLPADHNAKRRLREANNLAKQSV